MRIRNFIFMASAVVALLFMTGSYFVVTRITASTIRDNAVRSSDALAKITFSAMYQVMSTGWKRTQAEGFLAATQQAGGDSGLSLQIYRGKKVEALYDPIEQPPLDAPLAEAMTSGRPLRIDDNEQVRHIYPLVAEQRCLRCHKNTEAGETLGLIEIRQEFAPLLAKSRNDLMAALLALLPLVLLVAAGAVLWVGRRIDGAVSDLGAEFEQINAIADLRRVSLAQRDYGFVELNRVVASLDTLVNKLRGIAVDKDVLKFEIGLLEKFVITSDVVRDWREYVSQLLTDINRVMPAHMLFSIFKIDDELFDLEIFWYAPPSAATKALIDRHIHLSVGGNNPSQIDLTACAINHNISAPHLPEIVLSEEEVAVRIKSFFVEAPRIGGIVGIGVHTEVLDDETRHLVMDSVLSTLLNVVGSVKAIYKYTRDLEYYATRDPLTDLFNQRVFWELANYEIERAQRQEYSFGLLLVDLDNFKIINDNYGHPTGDKYLQQFSRCVQEALRAGDIFARYGGDEFVALLPETDLSTLAAVAERVREAVESLVIEGDGQRIHGTASIGIALFPDHAHSAKDLLLFADNMMYRAKAGGKDRVAIPTADDVLDIFRDITQKSAMVLDAIEQRRVVPFFQPILDVATHQVVAYEVLSRIEINGEIIRADQFVEIAEKMGVIHRLDTLVIEQALARLNEMGHQGEIFLNLSPRALVLKEFATNIRAAVRASGIAPERIVFEITERDTVKNITLLERFLNELKSDGYKLAIDDFGSGFSSFHYVRRFPIDYLKIEGDFIANMLNSPKDRAFVLSIRSLANELGITMVAEFVESKEVIDELRVLGVHLAQGYYIGRPQRQLIASDWKAQAEAPTQGA